MKIIMQLRIPKNLKNTLQINAKTKGYSLNALILKILWEYVEKNNLLEKEQ